jgi:hypothetical protein
MVAEWVARKVVKVGREVGRVMLRLRDAVRYLYGGVAWATVIPGW